MKVVYNTSDVRLQFVAPSPIQYVAEGVEATWSGSGTWANNGVPDTTNTVIVQNPAGTAQRVTLDNQDAFVHQLTVTGNNNTITVAVPEGTHLSATTGTTVGDKAIIELGGGSLVTSTATIQAGAAGGQLTGNGLVKGNLVVGSASGAQDGTLSPCSPCTPGMSAGGHVSVEGNYQQQVKGTLAIDIAGTAAGQFDTLSVTGTAQLGGTLQINAAELTNPIPGTTFPIIAAGVLGPNSVFQDVKTEGNNDIFFAPTYAAGPGAGGELARWQRRRRGNRRRDGHRL